MSRKKRRLFTATTPLGYSVFLERDRWRQIINHKHPAMANRLKEVQEAVVDPDIVRESTKDTTIHMYYRSSGSTYVCVVVAPANETEHFVVTTYETSNVKQGKQLWKK